MPTGVRTRYHLAINNKGYMLRGAPEAPAYIKEEAPTLVNQVATEELSYNELNGVGWRHWAQTDWSGGFQQLKFKDDGSFKDGQGVDVLSEYGSVKLQNDFTSAISISGSQKYGAHSVHDGVLILGSIKFSTASTSVYKITSAHVLSKLSAMAGISAVNSMSRFGDTTLIGMSRLSGTLKTLSKYTGGTTISGFRNTNPIVRAVKGIGIRAYIAEYIASTSGDRLSYATNLSAFTSAYNAGKNRQIKFIEDLNGLVYFFIADGRKVEMCRFDELSEKGIPIYTFEDLTNFGVTKLNSLIVITGTNNNKRVAFAFNGARLWPVFNDQLRDSTYDFSKPFQFDGNLHAVGAQWDGKYWFPGLYGKFASVQYTPFGSFNNKAYAYAVTGTTMKLAYLDTTKYRASGYVVGSDFGHQIGGVDKLVNSVDIVSKALATGQLIEMFYSTDGGTTFSSLGTMKHAVDGAISAKTLFFPSGKVTKRWQYKAQLVCSARTSTPTLLDVSFQYRLVPVTKKRWHLALDAGDEVKLLNSQTEQRDGKSLMADLWLEKEGKKPVIFEDVSSFSAKLVSGMAAADTTARIDNTRFMPRKGRIRAVSGGVIEEMTYTSAQGTLIKGLSRGQKNTKARAYSAAQQLDNFYTVLVTKMSEKINNTDQAKTESVAQVTLLEI